ncbi:unnamed protein product, partial [Rotaria sp. Silwood1]
CTTDQIHHFSRDQSDEILTDIRFAYISQMYAGYLVCPNKYVNVDRKQWNYFSDEHLFDDDDVHIVFNRTLTNSLPTLTHIDGENTEGEIFFDKLKSIGFYDV